MDNTYSPANAGLDLQLEPISVAPRHLSPAASRAALGARPRAGTERHSVDRLLDCLAGFYTQEFEAQEAVRLLQLTHGLEPSQLLLMRPSDAAPALFERLSRQWITRESDAHLSWRSERGVMAMLGALLAGFGILLWQLLDNKMDPELQLPAAVQIPLMLALVLSGALLGRLFAQAWRRRSDHPRFELQVHHQLSSGLWALVVHGVPWASQAAVLELVQTSSKKWCAEAKSTRRP